jgi:hypothetical protein
MDVGKVTERPSGHIVLRYATELTPSHAGVWCVYGGHQLCLPKRSIKYNPDTNEFYAPYWAVKSALKTYNLQR